MTITGPDIAATRATERTTPVERVPVRCVDSDVHPMPRRGEMIDYIPEPWRSKYFKSHRVGESIFYDAPDYAHSYAMRVDAFPPDGEFACSDPDLALKQLILDAGSDIAILEPTHGEMRLPEATSAFCTATNLWLANHWLDPTTTGTNAGADRSAWPSRTRRVRSPRSRSGPSTPTWFRC